MKRIQILLLPLLLLFSTFSTYAQAPKRWTSTDLHDGLQKLNFLGSALYFAAHPDDENTRLIAYLANVRHANTAYLSITRGDGGQNLVGPEISELLGVIRTQELLAARRIDGGQQFFSRANDFGFSKHPDETFNIWNKDQVLADAVWVIRKFQPDIIINRFDHRSPGSTHGHHTASAMLSVESFDLTGNKTAFPEQLKAVAPWQPARIFFNTSWWFYGSEEAFAKADKTNLVSVDVGTYLPKRGISVPEIAATSRSQHKSQGFGSSGSRGEVEEYLELVKGTMPAGAIDPFEGINTTWTRVKGGEVVGKAVAAALEDFDFDQPENSLPDLLRIQQLITALPDCHWKTVKLAEVNTLIEGVLGLFLEVVATDPSAAPGQQIVLNLEAINRSGVPVKLRSIKFSTEAAAKMKETDLLTNKDQKWLDTLLLPATMPLSNAYWLNDQGTLGMYTVNDQLLRGLPQTPPVLTATFELELYDQKNGQWYQLNATKPVVYKTTDPVKGELYSPFEVTPPVFVDLAEKVYIFADTKPQEIVVKVVAGQDKVAGELKLARPAGWRIEPETLAVELARKGQEANYKFMLYPPASGQEENFLTPLLTIGENVYTKKEVIIDYEHIPKQTLVLDATAKLVRLDIKKEGQYIGYLMGAGDDIPQSLEQIGYQVTLLDDRDMNTERLKSFDAIILGVRAYNTVDRMPVYQPYLLEYVEQGGTLIVQYNTNRGLNVPMEEMGPYPFKVSRDRVTVEEADVRMLAPDHPLLNEPNKISAADFKGWVQERGLYFPNEWAPEYTAILSCNDPGEEPRDGGLLVAPYGKGYYIYTGYSWFRELPAGVAGAYRLFANMISLGNKPQP
ncbi:MAG: LmbE family protein [Bacteroidetes bacterium]|nr:MAG: LmbE family protein [Bacteroidota bacterium]PTM11482.1 MAG: LmbE family protein [Bacteroidota bacterium]